MIRLALAVLLSSAAVEAAPFRFALPPGWTDVSPGAPGVDRSKLPQPVLAAIDSGRFQFLAFDFAGATPKFAANVNVQVTASPGRIEHGDEAALREGLQKQLGAVGGKVLEATVVDIEGVPCGRVVADLDTGGAQMRQVTYLLPGGDKLAILVASAERSRFKDYEPTFDWIAHATEGIESASVLRAALGRIDLKQTLIAALVGGLVAGALALARKRS